LPAREVAYESSTPPLVRRTPAPSVGGRLALLAVSAVECRTSTRTLLHPRLCQSVVRTGQPPTAHPHTAAMAGRVMRNVKFADVSQFAATSGAGTRSSSTSGVAGALSAGGRCACGRAECLSPPNIPITDSSPRWLTDHMATKEVAQ